MKFRASKFDIEKAERKRVIARARSAIAQQSSDKSIHVKVDSRGLHLRIGRKGYRLSKKSALRLARSIIKEMGGVEST